MELWTEHDENSKTVLQNNLGFGDKANSSLSEFRNNQKSEEIIKQEQLTTAKVEQTSFSMSKKYKKAQNYLYSIYKLLVSLAITFSFFQIGLIIVMISNVLFVVNF